MYLTSAKYNYCCIYKSIHFLLLIFIGSFFKSLLPASPAMDNLDNLISNPSVQQLVQSYNDIKKSLLSESSAQMNSAIKIHTSLSQLFLNVSTLFKQVTEKNNKLEVENQRLTAALAPRKGSQPEYKVKTEFKKNEVKKKAQIEDDSLYLPEDSEASQQRLTRTSGNNRAVKQEAVDQQSSANSVKSEYDSQAAGRNIISSKIKPSSIFVQPIPSFPKKQEKLILKDEFASIHKYVHYYLGPCLTYDDNHKAHWILKKQVMQDYQRWCRIQKRSPASIKMKLLQMEMTNQLKIRFPRIQTNKVKYEGLKFVTEKDQVRFEKDQTQEVSD